MPIIVVELAIHYTTVDCRNVVCVGMIFLILLLWETKGLQHQFQTIPGFPFSLFLGAPQWRQIGSGKKSILVKFRSHLTHLWESENIWMTSNPNRGLCKIWALFEKAGGGGVPMSILALLKAKKGKGKRIATRTDGVDFELLYPCRFI